MGGFISMGSNNVGSAPSAARFFMIMLATLSPILPSLTLPNTTHTFAILLLSSLLYPFGMATAKKLYRSLYYSTRYSTDETCVHSQTQTELSASLEQNVV